MRDLNKILQELQTLQSEYKGKPMPEDVGARFSELAKEAKGMQDEADRSRQIADVEAKSRVIESPELPSEVKRSAKSEGYVAKMTLGDFAVASNELKTFVDAGMPRAQWKLIETDVSSGRKGTPMVALTREAADLLVKTAPPTIGTRVIPFDRDPDFVLNEEYVPPTLLDVLNIIQTNSNSVEWVRRSSYTRGAATQSEAISQGVQGKKGQATQAYELVTTPIRTHAVFEVVTEQQLADWPQLSALINGDLNDDMNQYLEEQILYGNGSGTNFSGFFEGSNVGVAREESGDSLIDVVRRGITDIRRAQGRPNAVLMDPIDWESVVLQKGDDEHYIWAVVTENGVSRLWGLPVVETVKLEAADGERNVLIGDFSRGATLYDRMSRTVSVGLIDDQFVRNMRTILLEARAGFAIRRPSFFRKITTAEATS
jgi:HK97 family phage major capsid protein